MKRIIIAVVVVFVLLIAGTLLWDAAWRHGNAARDPLSPAPAANPAAPVVPNAIVPALDLAMQGQPIGDRVQALIAKLGDADAAVRAQAQMQLEKMGAPAIAALKQALATSPDPEVRARCSELLASLGENAIQPQPLAPKPGIAPDAPFAPPVAADGGGGGAMEQRIFIGPDGQQRRETIVKDGAGNVIKREVVVGEAAAPMAVAPVAPQARVQRRQQRPIHVPPGMDPAAAQAFVQAQQAQQNAFAQLDAMRAQQQVREAIQGNNGGGQLLQQLAPQAQQNKPGLQPPPPADLGGNPMAAFGARVVETGNGFRIVDVKANSAAEKAGLAVGDIIALIDGRAVTNEADIQAALDRAASGKILKIEVTRKGEPQTVEIVKP